MRYTQAKPLVDTLARATLIPNNSPCRQWSAQDSGSPEALYGIWGSGPSDVYAVGFSGTMLHFDGQQWNELPPVPFGEEPHFGEIWANGPEDILVCDRDGPICHWDGLAWTELAFDPLYSPDFYEIWGNRAGEFWISCDRYVTTRKSICLFSMVQRRC